MKIQKTIAIVLASIFIAGTAFSQNGNKVAHTIKGKVVDSNNNEPISYTNIGIEGTLYGTASDQEGNFELKIPDGFTGKNIYFSAVGFQNRNFPVNQLFDKEFNLVKLRAQSYEVGKVDVQAQNMVLIRILRMASENIRYNYGAGPFNLHFAYEKQTTINDTSENTTTAQVLLYDKNGYSNPNVMDAYRSRNYSVTKKDSDYSFASNPLKIDELLSLDWVRSTSGVLKPALLSDYRLSLQSQPNIDGKEYWVIAFKQQLPTLEGSGDFYATAFEGTITVRKDDYLVRSITGKVSSPKNNRQDRSLAVSETNNNYLKDVSYEFTVEYRDLLINQIDLSKSYTYEGDRYNENTVMQVTRAHANKLTVLNSRDYFPGE